MQEIRISYKEECFSVIIPTNCTVLRLKTILYKIPIKNVYLSYGDIPLGNEEIINYYKILYLSRT